MKSKFRISHIRGICKFTLPDSSVKVSASEGKTGINISIDRINSKKGYFKSNIRLVTDLTNRSIHNFEDKLILKHAKLILKKRYGFSSLK